MGSSPTSRRVLARNPTTGPRACSPGTVRVCSCCLGGWACGALLWQPEQTSTVWRKDPDGSALHKPRGSADLSEERKPSTLLRQPVPPATLGQSAPSKEP